MERSSMATRLRRPFSYDSDTSLPEALDEEEQDTLIEALSTQHASQNASYARILSLLPLLAAPTFLLNLAPSPPTVRVLSLSCILVTSYLAWALPPEQTGLSLLDRAPQDGVGGEGRRGGGGRRGTAGRARDRLHAAHSPASRYLPYLNVCLSAVISLMSLVRGGGWPAVAQGCLPALVYGVVLAAKVVMAGVDPGELRGLRYGYKGA